MPKTTCFDVFKQCSDAVHNGDLIESVSARRARHDQINVVHHAAGVVWQSPDRVELRTPTVAGPPIPAGPVFIFESMSLDECVETH